MRKIFFGIFIFLFSFSSPAISSNADSVLVLIYHEIIADNSKELGETVVSLNEFKKHMRYLAQKGYVSLSMDEFVSYLKGERQVPRKAIVLTFDDGWKNTLQAVPILKKYNFKASFWILGADWFGPDYMSWSQIRDLARDPNFEIGSHTMTHPWKKDSNLLTWLEGKPEGKGIKDVRYEIFESKRILEEKIGKEIKYLAWPCGWYNKELIAIAQEAGYQALLTAWQKPNHPGEDIFQIKRLFVDGSCDFEAFKSMLKEGRSYNCNAHNISIDAMLNEEHSLLLKNKK